MMTKKFITPILIICFVVSNTQFVFAVQDIQVPPVVVGPNIVEAMDQQMFALEYAKQNAELQNDQTAKINQSALSFAQAQAFRDRAGMVANEQGYWGNDRYGDLVKLTEDADAMTVRRDLDLESGLLSERYKILTDLKDEMSNLNDKLDNQASDRMVQKDKTIDGFQSLSHDQQDKIQTLITRLGEMDRRIAHYQDELEKRDQKIEELKRDLAELKGGQESMNPTPNIVLPPIVSNPVNPVAPAQAVSTPTAPVQVQVTPSDAGVLSQKDAVIKQLQEQLDQLRSEIKNTPSPVNTQPLLDQITQLKQNVSGLQSQDTNKDKLITTSDDQLTNLKSEVEKLTGLLNQSQKDKQEEHQSLSSQIDQLKANLATLQAKDNQFNTINSQLNDKNDQINLLKSELENKITELKGQASQLKSQADELATKDASIKSQADQLATATDQFKQQSGAFADIKDQIAALKARLAQQDTDIKSKDQSIAWLNQALAVVKDKSEYFKLTSQKEFVSMKELQEQMQGIKNDFTQHFKDYDQFQDEIVRLKEQVNHLNGDLTDKQNRLEKLQAQLDAKTAALNHQTQAEASMQQELKDQLAQRENQINILKAEVLSILQAETRKDGEHHQAVTKMDDRLSLAKQLIGLQDQEAALLVQKDDLEMVQNELLDRHVLAFEIKIKQLLAQHRMQNIVLQNRMQELQGEIQVKQDEINSLNAQLRDKISQEQNQTILGTQISDLNAQLQDKGQQINALKQNMQQAQNGEVESLKQQLADEQNKEDVLKEQLAQKVAQASKDSALLSDYQQKLENSNNDYSDQLGQTMASKNAMAQLQKQVELLTAQVQRKQNELEKLKAQMDDLQQNDKAEESKELSVATMQQKAMDDKLNAYAQQIDGLQATTVSQAKEIQDLKTQLAMAREEIQGMPSADEIQFLRTGLQKAEAQLKVDDAKLLSTKANADEYAKKYQEQSSDFQSLKQQLDDARDDLSRRNEDLHYKDLEITRLKEKGVVEQGDLQDQVNALKKQLAMAQGQKPMPMVHIFHGNKVADLEMQLDRANLQIKNLQDQLDNLEKFTSKDSTATKLNQALNEINRQGEVINLLVKKLRDNGQNVDLSSYFNKS